MALFNWRAVYDGRYLYSAGLNRDTSGSKPLRLTEVKDDPQDQVNLVDDSAHAVARAQLHDRLDAFLKN